MLEQSRGSFAEAEPASTPQPPPRRFKVTAQWRKVFTDLAVPRQDWSQPSGKIIAFAHGLKVPAGKFVGKPLRLRRFQIEFIRDVYNLTGEDGRRKRRQAILSIARRGGKTLLAAVLILIHLVGPAKRPHSTLVSAATTRKQASIVFRFVAEMVRLNPLLKKRLKVINSTKRIVHRHDGSVYEAISAEAGGAFGEGLDLVVYDELAQAKTPALYEALMTSLGAQVEPLMLIISTQSPADDHILSELIDYGLKVIAGEFEDDTFTVHLYAANDNAGLLDEKEWHRANPTLGDYRDIEELRATMTRAMKMPSHEAMVRNLYLNQRVQAKAPFLTANVWALGNDPVNEELLHDGRPVGAGLDLSARTDLSALVMAAEDDDGVIHLFPRVWTPEDTLLERALRDRAPYKVWADREFLVPVPGNVLNYDFLAADIGDLSRTIFFSRVMFDRWRIEVFKQSMTRLGVYVEMTPHGQGFKDMSPSIEIFEELAIAGRLRHGGHPVFRWCVSNAVIERDAADNRKLTKSKSFGRIDVAVAGIMAVAALKLQTEPLLDVTTLVA